jgi:hypothetical protein
MNGFSVPKIFGQGSFTIDPNASPEALRKKREAIQAMMPRFGQARYVGEGLGQLATGIGAGIKNRKMDKFEGDKRQAAMGQFDSVLGGQSAAPSGPMSVLGMKPEAKGTSFLPQEGNDGQGGAFPTSLVGTESGGNWAALNDEVGAGGVRGHGGRLQFGQGRLSDAARAGVVGEMSPQQFAQAAPEVQQAVEKWHFSDIDKAIQASGAGGMIGQTISGVPVTLDGLRAVAHLGGSAGMEKFVKSGGQYNPSDSFGTSLLDYLGTHAGGGQMSAASQADPRLAGLQQIAANPWLPNEQRAIVENQIKQMTGQQQAVFESQIKQMTGQQQAVFESQIKQMTGQQQAVFNQNLAQQQAVFNQNLAQQDPLYQAKLAQSQLDIEQDRNGTGAPTGTFGNLHSQAEAAGLKVGTPEYQNFMLNGGGDPATFRALVRQAAEAGFTVGTPEYQEFMATRGAGFAAGASQTAKNTANINTGGEAAAVIAQGTADGKARASSGSELREMERNMPGLLSVASQLSALADVATYTKAGQVRDEARKQAGLEPTEGAIARAEYIAVVDNQVLPLLRQTFGAAFTAKEGETLKNTLGDPNKSPAEKKAVLDAFIQQKQRDIKARRGEAAAVPPSPKPFDPQTPDFSQMSAEELDAYINGGNQ